MSSSLRKMFTEQYKSLHQTGHGIQPGDDAVNPQEKATTTCPWYDDLFPIWRSIPNFTPTLVNSKPGQNRDSQFVRGAVSADPSTTMPPPSGPAGHNSGPLLGPPPRAGVHSEAHSLGPLAGPHAPPRADVEAHHLDPRIDPRLQLDPRLGPGPPRAGDLDAHRLDPRLDPRLAPPRAGDVEAPDLRFGPPSGEMQLEDPLQPPPLLPPLLRLPNTLPVSLWPGPDDDFDMDDDEFDLDLSQSHGSRRAEKRKVSFI